MLVIGRKQGESVQIGPDIFVTVTQARGSFARLGIQAPAAVKIRRIELQETGPNQPDPQPTKPKTD